MNTLPLDRDLRQKAPVLEQCGALLPGPSVAPDPRVCPVLPQLDFAQIVPEVDQGASPRFVQGSCVAQCHQGCAEALAGNGEIASAI